MRDPPGEGGAAGVEPRPYGPAWATRTTRDHAAPARSASRRERRRAARSRRRPPRRRLSSPKHRCRGCRRRRPAQNDWTPHALVLGSTESNRGHCKRGASKSDAQQGVGAQEKSVWVGQRATVRTGELSTFPDEPDEVGQAEREQRGAPRPSTFDSDVCT
jgi:hypothetical protein